MKNALLLFCLLAMTTQISAQVPSVKTDEEAIKQVITDRTAAWANRDTVALADVYSKRDPSV